MLDFKKLAEVTSIEELPEGINVLVNDNGVVKQVPANKVGEMVPDILKKAAESGDGFGYTDGNELHQIDSKYIKSEELLPEELSNAIETHGMGWTSREEPVPAINITWDGDTEGREAILYDQYYKVSDEAISKEDIVGATVSLVVEQSDTESIIITEDNIAPYDNYPMYGIQFGDYVSIYVVSENFVMSDEELHKGVYFFESNDYYVSSLTKEGSTGEVVHQIDKKYLPETASPELINAMNDGGLGWSRAIPEIDIHWDGSTDGLVSLDHGYCRLSDVVLHPEDTDGIRFTYDGKTYIVGDNASIYVDSDDEEFKERYGADALLISIVRDDFNLMGEDRFMAQIVEGLPEEGPDGIYLRHYNDSYFVSSFYRPASFSNVLTKIDNKYLVEGGHGYTTVEDSGFDIRWSQYDDLDKYSFDSGAYLSKVSNFIPDLSNLEDVQLKIFGITFTYGASEDDGTITVTTDEDFPGCYLLNVKKTSVEDRNCALIIVPEPTTVNIIYGLPKGIYYDSSRNVGDDCRFYKPSNPQEVVHQIDSKYIPSSGGGATVIDFVVDEQGSVNCEYTPTQFLALMRTAPLVCVLDATVVGFPVAMPIVPFFFMDNDDNEHGLSLYIRTTSGLKPIVQGILSDDEWEFGL